MTFEPGLSTCDVSSGFFRYVDLHRALIERFGLEAQNTMPLYESLHQVDDALGLPERNLIDLLEDYD